MKLDWKHWLLGLVAAFIGGGASALTAGVSAIGIDPDHFNLQHGMTHTLELMGTVFLISGAMAAAAFLKQSPVPRETWTEAERAEKKNGKPPEATP